MEQQRASYPPAGGPQGPGTRCPKHDLVRGPSGECILCKRGLEERERARRGKGHILVPVICVVILCLAVGIVAYQMFLTEEPATAISQGEFESSTTSNRGEFDHEGSVFRGNDLVDPPQESAGAMGREVAPGRERSAAARNAEAPKKRKLDKYDIAASMRLVDVSIYYADWCPTCRKALAHMDGEGISYTGHDIEASQFARQERDVLSKGRKSVPVIKIDDQVMMGFSPGGLKGRMERAARKRAEAMR